MGDFLYNKMKFSTPPPLHQNSIFENFYTTKYANIWTPVVTYKNIHHHTLWILGL